MPLSVTAVMDEVKTFAPGDIFILNDPYRGGTHLPDITLVSPVHNGNEERELLGFVASRAHHADVGGAAPGSMSLAREIYQEGLIIPPIQLAAGREVNEAILKLLLANVRTPVERSGDLWAQIAANRRGAARLQELVARYSVGTVAGNMDALIAYTERLTRALLEDMPDGSYSFTDYLEDDGFGDEPVPIMVSVQIEGDQAVVDFSGSSPQVAGSLNAVYAVTLSAVYYVFRSRIGLDVPNNAGCLASIEVIAPEGSIVNAAPPSAVAGGNVETSQRIVDVLLGALAQACPERVPAASQGR